MARTRAAVGVPAPPPEDEEDDLADFGFGDEDAVGVTDEQRALVASFESIPEDANRRREAMAEAEARADRLAMRRAFVYSDLTAVAWQGQDHRRIDRENREIEDVIAGRDSAGAAATRDRERYHVELASIVVAEVARVAVAEAAALQAAAEAPPMAEEAARRAIWEAAMDEAHVRRVREDPSIVPRRMTFLETSHGCRLRRQVAKARKRNDDGTGPSGHGGGQ